MEKNIPPMSSFCRSGEPPPPPPVAIDQDHKIIGEPGVLDIGIPPSLGDTLRPLQHLVHLAEIDVAQQRGNDSPLWDAPFSAGLEDGLQQLENLGSSTRWAIFRKRMS